MPQMRGKPLSATDLGKEEEENLENMGISLRTLRGYLGKAEGGDSKTVRELGRDLEKKFGISAKDWDLIRKYVCDYEEAKEGREGRIFARRKDIGN